MRAARRGCSIRCTHVPKKIRLKLLSLSLLAAHRSQSGFDVDRRQAGKKTNPGVHSRRGALVVGCVRLVVERVNRHQPCCCRLDSHGQRRVFAAGFWFVSVVILEWWVGGGFMDRTSNISRGRTTCRLFPRVKVVLFFHFFFFLKRKGVVFISTSYKRTRMHQGMCGPGTSVRALGTRGRARVNEGESRS